jgi:hypothetical protein
MICVVSAINDLEMVSLSDIKVVTIYGRLECHQDVYRDQILARKKR